MAAILESDRGETRAPMSVNGTVIKLRPKGRPGGRTPPPRQRNLDRRPREYLTPAEVELLMAAAMRRGRHGHRDRR